MNYNRIKFFCTEKRITLKDLATDIEMTEQGLSAAFRNDTLKVRDLERIAKKLDMTVVELLDEQYTPAKDPKDITIETQAKLIAMQEAEIKTLTEKVKACTH